MGCYSSMTLEEVIKYVDVFCPVKIVFNNLVLYNDYDYDDYEMDEETEPPLIAIPKRIKNMNNIIIESLEIEIVQFHHSIIKIYGKQNEVVEVNLN